MWSTIISAVLISGRAVGLLFLTLAYFGAGTCAFAADSIQLLALTRDKAILTVNGTRRVLRVGETSPEGVTLKRATSGFAEVDINGVEQRLEPGPVTTPIGLSDGPGRGKADRVVLWADGNGFFHADGTINGKSVRFLIDTGASTVAISERTAEDLGLDVSEGRRGVARTASGLVGIVAVTLDEVRVGEMTLYNVSAGVVDGAHPAAPLLGMSFLNRFEMQREGSRMELRKR